MSEKHLVTIVKVNLLPFYPPNNLKNQNFEEMKKLPGDIIILHRCNINVTIIWFMAPEIPSVTDRIFCHFGPFFALLPP